METDLTKSRATHAPTRHVSPTRANHHLLHSAPDLPGATAIGSGATPFRQIRRRTSSIGIPRLSPTTWCRCEVIHYNRASSAQTRSKNPALQGRVLVARTLWFVQGALRTQPLFVPTCHVATGRR